MGIVTSQQLTRYYELYRDTEVIFSKEVIKTLHMDPRQVYVKCTDSQWPCIINSTSFLGAKIIIGSKGGAYARLSKEKGTVNLRFCFSQGEKQPISFFVSARVQEIVPYMESSDLAIVNLTYIQRPPDDLIELIGRLLEANTNALRRRDERIPITEESLRKLSLAKADAVIFIDNVPRHCIVRDISFSGAKILLLGVAQFLNNKNAVLRLEFYDPHEVISLPASIVKTDMAQGRKDIIIVCLQYDATKIPITYKLHINNYLTGMRKSQLSTYHSAPVTASAVSATPRGIGNGSSQNANQQAQSKPMVPLSARMNTQEEEVTVEDDDLPVF
ncbi:MAG: PilZ domain-containing protein [Treponema sp.]|nr:PilZ domain-containing protein [Spirochaetaceae bacterium]MCI6664073.1 PilZ domain-containing protein [Spirochaetia bacterium]MDD7274242.1 PilZ domain-containing protein [Treponema sp.]MDY3756451.1 PilZ domain-containing protein [Treponema sp.]MDY4673830.1 PilZ domain-containing protein [Treponema sp.]